MKDSNTLLNQEKFQEIWRHISVTNKEMGAIAEKLNDLQCRMSRVEENQKWELWLSGVIVVGLIADAATHVFFK